MRHDDCMKPTSLLICSALLAAWGQPGDWTEQAISSDRATAQNARAHLRDVELGDCTLNSKVFELRRGEKSVALSAREIKLFQLFIGHPEEVLSRDRILNEVWGYEYYGTTRALDQSIVQLRKRLSEIGADPKQIATVHTVGYRWFPAKTIDNKICQ